jgi:hypothetical protein
MMVVVHALAESRIDAAFSRQDRPEVCWGFNTMCVPHPLGPLILSPSPDGREGRGVRLRLLCCPRATKLKERTLTNLYDERPPWLADAHDALDRAVAAAYGWPEDIATDNALARLLPLNLVRANAQQRASAV